MHEYTNKNTGKNVAKVKIAKNNHIFKKKKSPGMTAAIATCQLQLTPLIRRAGPTEVVTSDTPIL